MGNLIHIAEIAGMLALAYLIGWPIGYVAHRLVSRSPRQAEIVPAARIAAATGIVQPDDALVKAPAVVPVASNPLPQLATPVAAAETSKTELAGDALTPPAEIAAVPPPPRKSGIAALRALAAAMPLMPAEAAPEDAPAETSPPTAEIAAVRDQVLPPVVEKQPEPVVAAAELPPIAPAPPAMPSNQPGIAWAGSINGHEAAPFELPPAADAPTSPDEKPPVIEAGIVAPPKIDAVPTAAESPVAIVEASVPESASDLEQTLLSSMAAELNVAVENLPPAAEIAASAPSPVDELSAADLVQPTIAAAAPSAAESDEDAAMRAIEGGWSRRKARALPDAPELTDVTAAVSKAQMAVEQVLARNGVDPNEHGSRAANAFGKPHGLSQARNDQRDDLKRIDGLGQLDESTLNNLGIFHLDQIAAWNDKEVLWLENHAFALGRIGRENWQEQARSLLAAPSAQRAAN